MRRMGLSKMAADTKCRSSGTIAFTLPISCQICLGKVKAPVTCPNHHVFCEQCMDVWLQKNQQCPACRTPITEETPLRKVLGGLNQADESMCDSFSNPELRRTRLELLVRDYEDEIERMQGHLVNVEGENKMLKERLQRLTPDSDSGSEKEGKDRSVRGSSSDMNVLLVMTKKLQDANALYEKAKKDSAKYKEKNRNLTDENINLVRENQRLRIEIANRSPMKYGRFTVSAMQSKIDAYEKQVIQLQKALEKSDTYIEEVEKELEAFRKEGTAVYASSVHAKMDTKSEADKRAETCRKSLFGGLKLHKDAESENKMAENYCEDNKMSSNPKMPPSGLVQLAAWRLEHGDDVSEKSSEFSTFKPDDLDSRHTSTFITGRSSLGGPSDTKHVKVHGSFDADLPSPIVGTPSLPSSRLKIKNDSDDGPSRKRRSQPEAAEGQSGSATDRKEYEMPEVCRNVDDKDENSSDLPTGLSDSGKIYERSCSRSSSGGSSGPPTPTRRFPTMGISASYAISHSPGAPAAKDVLPITVQSSFIGYSLYSSMDETRPSPPALEPLASVSGENTTLFNQGTGIYGIHRHRTHSNGSTGLNSYNATASLALAKSTSVLPQPDSTTEFGASKPETESGNSNESTTDFNCSITPEFSDCLKILNEAEKKVGRRKLEGVDSLDGDSNSEKFTVEKCEDAEPQYESLNFRSRSDADNASTKSTDSHSSTDSLKSTDFRSTTDNSARIVHSKKFTSNPHLKGMCDNLDQGRRFSLGGKLGEMRQNLKHFLRRTPEKRKRSEGGTPCEDMLPCSPSKTMKLSQ